MPASPSFPSGDGRGKWKRRKREQQPTQISNKKQKHQEDPPDDDDEDDAVDEDNDQLHRDDSEGPTPNNLLLLHHQLPPDPTAHLESEVLSDAVRISDFPLVTKRDVNRPHPSVMAVVALERANSSGGSRGQQGQQVLNLENVSYGQLLVFSAVPPAVAQEAIAPVAPAPAPAPPAAAAAGPSDQERSDGGNSAGPPYVITPPQIMEGKGVVKRFGSRVHVVPMHSDWFSPATVNRLERQVVPHFFSGKSPDHTPVKYMECRNYIVAKYMENPERRLLVSDCQGLVVGIANEDVARIFRFLDNWGIINYCAAPPVPEPWNGRFFLREEPTGEIRVPSDALKSIDSLIKFDKPKCRLRAADVYSSLYCHDDDLSDLDDRIRERLSENRCNHCSCVLPSAYYQSQKEADVLLCSECFHEGRFVIGHSSLDFVKVDSPKDYGDIDGENWTDQETLLLLEAMEMYNENWNEIAEHVGTKSKAQCILHFLRLPMEDSLLENIEVPKASKSSNPSNRDDHGRLNLSSNGELPGSDLQDSDTDSRLPFANSGNPVMALVAFLSHTVGPRVAAACAHASLAVLCEDNRMNSERLHGMEGSFHGEVRNSIQQKEGHQHGSRGQNEAQYTPLSAEKVKSAAKAGLAAAATKAKLFADHEEREIQRLSANVINQQFKRLELKLKQFAEVEGLLLRECEQAEKARQRFVAERARLLSTQVAQGRPGVVTSQMNLAGAAPSMVNSNNISNARPQMMPASSSQPSVSGYGNNQQVPPHMSFVQRGQPQQMFPLGPRLPLSAIQPSSSASSNAMFNPSGNSQPGPGLNQMLRSVSGSGPSSGLG